MFVPLKFIVCSLKLVRLLPWAKMTPWWWIHQGVSTPHWWIHQGVSTPLWWTDRRDDLFGYLEQASEKVHKTSFWWQIDKGVKTLQCINQKEVLTPRCILHYEVFFINQFRSTPLCIHQLLGDEYTGESLFLGGGEYTESSLDSRWWEHREVDY
jgi:hypothetical protein